MRRRVQTFGPDFFGWQNPNGAIHTDWEGDSPGSSGVVLVISRRPQHRWGV